MVDKLTSALESQIARYQLVQNLINNFQAQTWIAVDRHTKKRVILKTALLGSSAIVQIEKEIEFLRSLQNPFLPRLIDFGATDQWRFLVREFIDGEALSESIARGPLSARTVFQLANDIFSFLKDLHSHGIIHQDLKPDNIILQNNRATVIDFGLSRMASPTQDEDVQHRLVGSVRYMAPEQAGTLKYPVRPNADLFSVGCILYECLTGDPLYEGETVHEVLQQQLEDHAEQKVRKLANVPRAVQELLARLIEKDPNKRYQKAEAALDDTREVIWRLNANEQQFNLSRHRGRLALSEPDFIARDRELQQLQLQAERTRLGFGQLVLLEGESGSGKSRLLSEFIPEDAWVLRGQGVDQSANHPFQIFNQVIEGIAARVQNDSDFRTELHELLSPYSKSISDAFPLLRDHLAFQSLQIVGPEELAEQRVLQAATILLNALGTEERPAIVVLDDVQWADELSLKLLSYWASSTSERKTHTMIVAAFRSEEMAAEHSLRAIRKKEHILVPAFTRDDIDDLIQSMAGDFPPEVSQLVSDLSNGNVFMACSVIHGLYECNAIQPSVDGWKVNYEALKQAQSSRKAAVFLAKRLQKFPSETLHALRIAAVLGKEFDFDLLQKLTGLSNGELLHHLQEAHVRKVIWMRTEENKFAFAHDKIRETLLASLSEIERRNLHLLAAQAIETGNTQRCFELAYHFSKAGELIKAFPYAMAAGRQARMQHALRLAETYFEIALPVRHSFSVADQIELLEALGDVYMLLGKYEAARQQFEAVRELDTERLFRSQMDGKIGELLFKQGNIEEAAIKVEQALRSLECWVPKNKIGFLIGTIWEAIIQFGHCWWGLRRHRTKPSALVAQKLKLYSRLAYINWFGKGALACLWAHLREMNLAERHLESLEMAQAYSEHAPVMTQLPWFKRGEEYGLRSLEIRRRLGDVWGEAQSLHFLGVVLYSSGKFREALERCREAMQLFERTGDRWEANTASWHSTYSHYRLGNFKEAIEFAKRTFESGRLIGDHHATGISLSAWAKITNGRVPESFIREEIQRNVGDAHTRVEILVAEAIRLLRLQEFDESISYFRNAVRIVREKGLRQEYVVPAQVWLATAIRKQLAALPQHELRERTKLVASLKVETKRALRLARFYRNNWPHALRESAWYYSFIGHSEKAETLLNMSIAYARTQLAKHEEGQSVHALGEILKQPELVRQGEAIMAQCERPMLVLIEESPTLYTVSLVDRFAKLMETGGKILSALDRKQVLGEATSVAQALLRADDCKIIEIEEGRPPKNEKFSEKLFEAAVARRRAVCMEEFLTQDATDSLILMEAESALYCPIFVEDKLEALLMATHEGVTALFGNEEKQLAEYIVNLTSTALKNAERVHNIQHLSDEKSHLFEQAQKAIEARDQFLSLASHELKTPITALLLQNHRFARPECRDEPVGQFTATFDRQLNRLNRLVDDLLDVSRLTSGKFSLTNSRQPFFLDDLIKDVVSEVRIEMEQGGCELEIEIAAHIQVYGDSGRLSQVLINLLTNAKKYAPGLVEVRLHRRNGGAYLEVIDHGPGINPEYQRAIFERFERVPQRNPVGGLGLGLYISREIVRDHGGELTVESQPDVGSKFSFWLPELN